MKVTDIAFTVYPSNDVASARAWYERNLGLVFAGAYMEDGVENYNEAHFASGCFALMAKEWVGLVGGQPDLASPAQARTLKRVERNRKGPPGGRKDRTQWKASSLLDPGRLD